MDDSSLDVLRSSGDAVRLEAQSGPLVARAEYVIDAPASCHVRKVSGPDTVWAQYLPD